MPQPFIKITDFSSSSNPAEQFNQSISDQFYSGDTYFKGKTEQLQFDSARTSVGLLQIYHSQYSGQVASGMKRNWQNIRRDNKYFYTLWIPVSGAFHINQDSRVEEIPVGSFAITYSNRPLIIEARTNEQSIHKSYEVVIPAHVMKSHLPGVDKITGKKFSFNTGDSDAARQSMITLFEDGHKMTDKIISLYVNASLEALSASLTPECRKIAMEHDLKKMRIRDIIETIDTNLSDPTLSVANVASACNISSRYVHQLLKEADLSFSDYVWQKRLEYANQWLTNPENCNEPVANIAYCAGFRSVSHFSRCYKKTYGKTPSSVKKLAGVI